MCVTHINDGGYRMKALQHRKFIEIRVENAKEVPRGVAIYMHPHTTHKGNQPSGSSKIELPQIIFLKLVEPLKWSPWPHSFILKISIE